MTTASPNYPEVYPVLRQAQEPLVHWPGGAYLALGFLEMPSQWKGPVSQQLLQNTRNHVFSSSDKMSDLLGNFNKQKSTYQEGWCLCKNTETVSEKKPESSKLKQNRAQIQERVTLNLQGQRESSELPVGRKLNQLCG